MFAAFGGPIRLADSDLEGTVRAARSPWLANDDIPAPDGTSADSPLQWPGTELVRSGQFADVRQISIERRSTLAVGDYLGHLSTVSAYLELSKSDRRHVVNQIRAVLPARVAVVADVTLHLARLR